MVLRSPVVLVASFALLFGYAAGRVSPAALASEQKTPAETAVHVIPEPQERVEVVAARLPDAEQDARELPALVTVIERERIERSGTRTVQDLLSFETGVILYDQVGNDIQKTLDLRGFASGTGTAVYLDGARVNDPKNNTLALELIPIDALERVEVVRGSAAAVAGGGSEAGIVHLRTRHGEGLTGSVRLGTGSDSATALSGSVLWGSGRWDGFFTASRDRNEGFRENAGGELDRWAASVGLDVGDGRRMSLTATSSDLGWGTPGALTREEWDTNPGASPFNRLDRIDDSSRLATIRYAGPLAGNLSLSANLFTRDRATETLSTGRAASSFGGFFLDAATDDLGSTLQVDHTWESGRFRNRWIGGVEWREGDTRSLGSFTPASNPGSPDLDAPDADNLAEHRAVALFFQNNFSPAQRWNVTFGARSDRDRIVYEERLPDPSLRDQRSYSELSLRGGITFAATDRVGLWIGYGESFLPPTVEEAFAFPGFGSNRDLDPEDSRSYEGGVRVHFRSADLDAAVFRIDTRDEILFDPTPTPDDPFGRNVNGGRTSRRGVEVVARGRASDRIAWFASATYVNAEFVGGTEDGNRVPLVPSRRFGAGFDASLPAGFALRVEGLHVGPQILDNDRSNSQPSLEAYSIANVRLSWAPPLAAASEGRGPAFYAEVRNATDATYATRGIRAFDFSTFEDATFYTPAPGRRWYAGLEWRF